MLLDARLPGGASDEPLQILKRALWYRVRRRMHYARIAMDTAQLFSAAGNTDAASGLLKNYLNLVDPKRDDAVEIFAEKAKEMLRLVNEEGAVLKLSFTPREIALARKEQAVKDKKSRKQI